MDATTGFEAVVGLDATTGLGAGLTTDFGEGFEFKLDATLAVTPGFEVVVVCFDLLEPKTLPQTLF